MVQFFFAQNGTLKKINKTLYYGHELSLQGVNMLGEQEIFFFLCGTGNEHKIKAQKHTKHKIKTI